MDELIRRVDKLERRVEAMSDEKRRARAASLVEQLRMRGVQLNEADLDLVARFGEGSATFDELARGLGDKLVGI